MTAQIVVTNKYAAAIASDSSMTVMAGSEARRTFATADKIFPLGAPHRLAVMHSGATDLLGVPYAVMVAEWRNFLEPRGLATVADYARSFQDWLESHPEHLPETQQKAFFGWMVRDFYLVVRADIIRYLEEDKLDSQDWSLPGVSASVTRLVEARRDQLASRDDLVGHDQLWAQGLARAYGDVVEKELEWVFDDVPRSVAGDDLLREIAVLIALKDEPYSRDGTLVFVGFGEGEIFPAQQVLECRGFLDGRLRKTPWDYAPISLDNNATVSPYGQTEAVNTFLRAYHSAFLDSAHSRLDRTIQSVRSRLADTADLPDGLMDQVCAAAAEDAHAGIDDDYSQLSWDRFVEPMIGMVANLPAANLARMAESLVGLQVLRQMTQAEMETVGGPVDVGVVTRESGFSWLRRKTVDF